jgi:hypothetical protein
MALEVGTHIDDLDQTNPVSTDGIGQADDHIRLIKKTILNTFPNITGPVLATQVELNLTDGLTSSVAELNTLDGYTGTVSDLNKIVATTAFAFELNKLDGAVVTTAEINKLSGLSATTGELDTLAGITASTSELNKVDGYTGNSSDLNILTGAAAAGVSSTEFRRLNGVTGSIQTQLNARLSKSGGSMTGTLTMGSGKAINVGGTELHGSSNHLYMDVNGGGNFYVRDGNSSNATRFTFDVDYGNFTASGDVTAFSDARLKTNVETVANAVDLVSQMRGVFFEKDGRKSVGVIAQEMARVLPEVIHGKDGEYLSVAYGNIVGVLIEAVKELKSEIETLKKGD